MYQLEQWLSHRWQSDTRYYTAEVIQDLFGTWIFRCGWGGLSNRKGNHQEKALTSYDEGLVLLKETNKRRQERGYFLISIH